MDGQYLSAGRFHKFEKKKTVLVRLERVPRSEEQDAAVLAMRKALQQ